MNICHCTDVEDMGRQAASLGVSYLKHAIAEKNSATIVLGTGASQLTVLSELVAAEGIDWTKVVGFHLDEYIGISESHPASFRKYLQDRFVSKVPISEFHFVNPEGNPHEECERLEHLLSRHPIDLSYVGIGENGHLAFNDPPADFESPASFLVVELDDACREQQFKEGWFESVEAVPKKAITMSVSQIMKSHHIICTVHDPTLSLLCQRLDLRHTRRTLATLPRHVFGVDQQVGIETVFLQIILQNILRDFVSEYFFFSELPRILHPFEIGGILGIRTIIRPRSVCTPATIAVELFVFVLRVPIDPREPSFGPVTFRVDLFAGFWVVDLTDLGVRDHAGRGPARRIILKPGLTDPLVVAAGIRTAAVRLAVTEPIPHASLEAAFVRRAIGCVTD